MNTEDIINKPDMFGVNIVLRPSNLLLSGARKRLPEGVRVRALFMSLVAKFYVIASAHIGVTMIKKRAERRDD